MFKFQYNFQNAGFNKVSVQKLASWSEREAESITLLYEQEKQTSASLRNSHSNPQQNVEQNVNWTNSTVTTTTFVLPEPPFEDAKENFVVENGGMVDLEKVVGCGESRILVFVRVRPTNKREREVGSRCCVKITNQCDVYLSEFANENDYLRLNRIRGRHFTFDASFLDSATQQEVYATT
ncbi:unnamed protein product [Lupinus luteus]|uniref:Kinesin motor domain-containing protein n=1 Tax=Lupinus luteus TaxID=3873 RepID=A0AAV1VY36_LUPLU